MAGSPRVERAARIRLENPNLSTEEAMKIAGYSEEEAKDQKRQSNVRQKTHRLQKSRKRSAETELHNPEPSKRMSFPPTIGMHHDSMYQQHGRRTMPLHMPEQNMMHDYSRMPPMDMPFSSQQQSTRMPMDSMSISHQHQQHQQQHQQQPMRYPPVDNMMPMIHQQHQSMQQQHHHPQQQTQHQPQHLQHQQQQELQQQPLPQLPPQHVPYNTPARATKITKPETSSKSPGGSPRVERAAKLRLQDPTVSTEEAMKLAGFTPEEAKDKKKQNNVRQKTHRMSLKQAPKSSQKATQQDIAAMLKEEIGKLEVKLGSLIESFEQRVEHKFKELGDRIDQKFAEVLSILQIRPAGDMDERRRGLDPRSPPKDPESNQDMLDTIQL